MPRLATVVPNVVSFTVMPTMQPRVNREFTSGRPHTDLAAAWTSMWTGCVFMVSSENHRLSVSLMVRVHSWSKTMPSSNRSEEHTSELQSLMRISYAVFCLKKKIHSTHETLTIIT